MICRALYDPYPLCCPRARATVAGLATARASAAATLTAPPTAAAAPPTAPTAAAARPGASCRANDILMGASARAGRVSGAGPRFQTPRRCLAPPPPTSIQNMRCNVAITVARLQYPGFPSRVSSEPSYNYRWSFARLGVLHRTPDITRLPAARSSGASTKI